MILSNAILKYTRLSAGLLLLVTGCVAPGTTRRPNQPRPLTVWAVGESTDLARDSEPEFETEIYSASQDRINLVAAINETVGFQLALRSELPASDTLDLSIADLNGSAGNLTSRENVRVFRVHDREVARFASWYPEHTGRSATPRNFADVLVPWDAPRGGGPLRMETNRTEIVWVDVQIPPGTPPGIYNGRIEIKAANQQEPAFTCALQLRVVPVVIPGARGLPLLCKVDPRDLLVAHLNWTPQSAAETRFLKNAPTHQAARRLIASTMRLFHEHRTTPMLWANFPKYQPVGERDVTIDWEDYDALAGPWLSGDAFADGVGLNTWPAPVSLEHPNAANNGGFGSARYARLLAAYLGQCDRHFAECGWLPRAVLDVLPPAPLSALSIAQIRRMQGIVYQSESAIPLIAHAPPRTLAALGWYGAPEIDLPETSIWCPPGRWLEPSSVAREQAFGRQVWLMPDYPPYSGSLAVAAPATDARVLPWIAFRYNLDALWVERAATLSRGANAAGLEGDVGLVYSGTDYGLIDEPVPSIRLKRLRRGLLDYELLRLLAQRGRPLLATRAAEQIVRYALTDACTDNLLSTRPAGWPREGRAFDLARRAILAELAGSTADAGNVAEPIVDWGNVLGEAAQVDVDITGVRLKSQSGEFVASVFATMSSRADIDLRGRWRFPAPPVGWEPLAAAPIQVPARGVIRTALELKLASLTYNLNGIYPFQLALETDQAGAFTADGRLAVAACPLVEQPPRVDGDLSDWLLASNNAIGDFRLVRGDGQPTRPGGRVPTRGTQAFFCMDGENVYIAVRCELGRGELPLWRADNRVELDGAIPWGQDLIEIVIDPFNTPQGSAENCHCLQIKPSGLLLARRGCLTDPPMNPSEPWQSDAAVAVKTSANAWVVEVSIPLASLGEAAQTSYIWGCNVTRLDARRGEYSSWSGARGHAYAPQRLGNLVLLRP